MSDVLSHALLYSQLGMPVFPVDREKKPLTPRGFKDATTDEDRIRNWWKPGVEYNNRGIAIATGNRCADNIVVIDVDGRKGGLDTLGELGLSENLETPICNSGSGNGIHIYFCSPLKSFSSNQGKLGEGIDVRADGGYIIAPPSPHESGNRYEWRPGQSPMDVEFLPLPEQIIDGLSERTSTGSLLFRERESGKIEEGERHLFLVSSAGRFWNWGYDKEEIYKFLHAINDHRCVPPTDDREIQEIVKSIDWERECNVRISYLDQPMRKSSTERK